MGFDAEWLALRASADQRALSAEMLAAAEERLTRRAADAFDPLIVDVGCGAGANLRRLRAGPARWRLIDNDAALLGLAADAAVVVGARAETKMMDLAAPKAALEEALANADLVIASAFFDLVSEAWIDRFVAALPDGAALYAPLIYTGEKRFSPGHPEDAAVEAAFNRHQRGDKGFGPALGPAAAAYLTAQLERAGRPVRSALSDWRLQGARDGALIRELARGVAAAVQEIGVPAQDWLDSQQSALEVRVSHVDLFAEPRLAA